MLKVYSSEASCIYFLGMKSIFKHRTSFLESKTCPLFKSSLTSDKINVLLFELSVRKSDYSRTWSFESFLAYALDRVVVDADYLSNFPVRNKFSRLFGW